MLDFNFIIVWLAFLADRHHLQGPRVSKNRKTFQPTYILQSFFKRTRLIPTYKTMLVKHRGQKIILGRTPAAVF